MEPRAPQAGVQWARVTVAAGHREPRMSRKSEKSAFTRFAQATATFAGRPVTFATATMIVLLWAVLGPVFGYSDTWQLVINTGTTIVTRSEEHTSELQSLMRISYAVFCLKNKKKQHHTHK